MRAANAVAKTKLEQIAAPGYLMVALFCLLASIQQSSSSIIVDDVDR